MCTLLQAMMLLDSRYEGYEFSSISADEIMRYAAHIKNNYSDEQKERLYDIINYLEKVFPEKDKMLKKINIPIVILAADTAMGSDYNSTKNIYRVGPMYFRQWFSYFFDECYEDYRQYCSSGSIKKEKTLKRIEIMEHSFRKYFELEENPLPDKTVPSDETTHLTDADFVGIDSSGKNESEDSGLQKETDLASVAEDTDSYTASVQTGTAKTDEEEKPPEEVDQYTK